MALPLFASFTRTAMSLPSIVLDMPLPSLDSRAPAVSQATVSLSLSLDCHGLDASAVKRMRRAFGYADAVGSRLGSSNGKRLVHHAVVELVPRR